MQRLATRLVLSGSTTRTAQREGTVAVLFLLRRSSDLSRARHMRSQPSPTTSTEPPSRIPKTSESTPVDTIAREATKATATATQAENDTGSQSEKEEILYERSPSWWIKWVWVLIGMDIIWSGNFAEFIWNRWTRQVSSTKGDQQATPKKLDNDPEWTPRPMWQRAGLTLLVLAGGTGIALALLLAQARTITRIIRLPRAGASQVRIETARNWHGRGRVVEQADITARSGRDDSELIVKLPDSRGEFLLGLDGAYVRGTTGDVSEVRQNFNRTFPQWKGLKRDTNVIAPGLGRWKSGPAA
ncbi:hypothetical protein FS749_007555 [Ceratobasidium sp. UAMH 11750]|nr:hypothetical protein FS749_007555 [Ceratobasidium sp. UAMH 11750]